MEDLKTEMYKKISLGDNVHNVIAYAENVLLVMKIPQKRNKPYLRTNHTTKDVEIYLLELKDFDNYNPEREIYIKNIETTKNIILDFIKEKAHLHLVPEQYRENVWNKANDGFNRYGELYDELHSLTDIFYIL